MPVAPDLLLTPSAVAKPKAPAANTAQNTAEPRKQEASSFSQVYAKERQAKTADRQDDTAKTARDGNAEAEKSASDPTPSSDQAPAVADSGKDLPADPPAEEDLVDPLLMFGLFEPQLVPEEVVDPAMQAQPASISVSLVGSTPVADADADAGLDTELDALDPLAAMQLSLEPGAQQKVAEQAAVSNGSASTSASASSGQAFASAMASMGMKTTTVEGEAGETIELPQLELSTEGLEALKESSADTAPEQFVSKLSALSQVIGQQASQAGRVTTVPGPALSMQQTGWSEGVVDKVMWMSSQNLKSADIQLDPAELGRLDVRISLNQDQTQISFASAHPGVREALEGQVHRLREMFTQQGMNLGDVNVSDQSQGRAWQGQGQDGESRGRNGRLADDGGAGIGEEERVIGSVELRDPVQGAGRGMVDYYA
ncbi:flagellar hook-length control protein FliK [Pseudomonas flavescens]|uniref:Flagellar hook-length control protein FliK n=1 Tax=Phytopseudomonas flavescens TaxID=29435 RepID=A0A1G8CBX0_9GAMM|nr:flagellar hook-length control protein FliK [Pseudomonas flavescens]SDH42885.1 flagellar hook-length control protein FliK [Pseudomonas flavescens]